MKIFRFAFLTVKVLVAIILGSLIGALFALAGCLAIMLTSAFLIGVDFLDSTAMFVICILVSVILAPAGFLIGFVSFFSEIPPGGLFCTNPTKEQVRKNLEYQRRSAIATRGFS